MNLKNLIQLLKEPFYAIVFIASAFLTLCYILLPIDVIFYFSAVIYPPVAITPFIIYLAFFKTLRFSWEDKLSVLLFFTAIASLSWAIGEIIWCYYYNLLLNIEVPYPSEADIFYIAGDVLAVIGQSIYLMYLYKVIGPPLKGEEKILVSLVVAILSIIAGIALAYPLIYWYSEEEAAMIEIILDSLYLLLELIMVIIALIGILVIRGRLGKVFLIILASNLLYFVYTIGFSYLDLAGLYYDGHPVELLDIFSSIADACAIYEAYKLAIER